MELQSKENQYEQAFRKLENEENQQKDLLEAFKLAFRGRTDVVPKYWESNGNKGYTPVCTNLFRKGVCPKGTAQKTKCSYCPNQSYTDLTDRMLMDHFKGSHILGVYPLLPDNTCHFIAADFDDHVVSST
jgi:hypothetical protein